MGVEPTRDRAERPPSRFEDGETHRGPYTSIINVVNVPVFSHSPPHLSSLTFLYNARTFSTSTSVKLLTINSASRKPGKSRFPATAIHRIPAACAACTPATASSITTHRPAETPSSLAAFRKISGAGFPRVTVSPDTSTVK